MEIQRQFKSLLSAKVDRKDFVKHLAIGTVALLGAGVLQRLRSATLNAAGQGYRVVPRAYRGRSASEKPFGKGAF